MCLLSLYKLMERMPPDIDITWKHPKVYLGKKQNTNYVHHDSSYVKCWTYVWYKQGKKWSVCRSYGVSSDSGKGLGGLVLVAEISCSFPCVSVWLGPIVTNSSSVLWDSEGRGLTREKRAEARPQDTSAPRSVWLSRPEFWPPAFGALSGGEAISLPPSCSI